MADDILWDLYPRQHGKLLDQVRHLSWLLGVARMSPDGLSYGRGGRDLGSRELVDKMVEIASADYAMNAVVEWDRLRRKDTSLPERPTLLLKFLDERRFGRHLLEGWFLMPIGWKRDFAGLVHQYAGEERALLPLSHWSSSLATWKLRWLQVPNGEPRTQEEAVRQAVEATTICIVHAAQEQILARFRKWGEVFVPHRARVAWTREAPWRIVGFEYLDDEDVAAWEAGVLSARRAAAPEPARAPSALPPAAARKALISALGSAEASSEQGVTPAKAEDRIGDHPTFVARVRAAFPKRRLGTFVPHLLAHNRGELRWLGLSAQELAAAMHNLQQTRPDLFTDWPR